MEFGFIENLITIKYNPAFFIVSSLFEILRKVDSPSGIASFVSVDGDIETKVEKLLVSLIPMLAKLLFSPLK